MLAVFTGADAAIIAAVVAAIPAVFAVMNTRATRKVADQQAAVATQFAPNGGSSMRDAIDRIEATQQVHHADVLDVKADLRETHSRLRSVEAALRTAQVDRTVIAAEIAALETRGEAGARSDAMETRLHDAAEEARP